ncbi:hypothetical protein Aperf_G00000046952 [Anoplocephala perfoliata]
MTGTLARKQQNQTDCVDATKYAAFMALLSEKMFAGLRQKQIAKRSRLDMPFRMPGVCICFLLLPVVRQRMKRTNSDAHGAYIPPGRREQCHACVHPNVDACKQQQQQQQPQSAASLTLDACLRTARAGSEVECTCATNVWPCGRVGGCTFTCLCVPGYRSAVQQRPQRPPAPSACAWVCERETGATCRM